MGFGSGNTCNPYVLAMTPLLPQRADPVLRNPHVGLGLPGIGISVYRALGILGFQGTEMFRVKGFESVSDLKF